MERREVPADDLADGGPPAAGAPTTAALVQARVAAQVAELRGQDAPARAGDEDAVHDLRVAARRLRGLLATCRPVLDRGVTDPVRDELRWLGGEAGAARDAQVQRARLLARLDVLPDDLVLGPVRHRAEVELGSRERAGLERVRAALGSDRALRLLAGLDALAVTLPFTEAAERDAGELMPRLVRRQVRRVARAARDADHAAPAERDAALHEVRKAAKRARYAAESATAVAGKHATRLAGRMRDLQELLGEHQDAVTARWLHRELAAAAHAAGENAFTFGVLRAEEDAVARAAQARYPDVLRQATSRKAAGWTR